LEVLRDLNQRQSDLLLMVSTFLARYEPPELQSVIDDDVAEAAAALAATFETSSRGVIYEHRPASLQAERLVSGLKPLLAEAGKGGGTPFERDAAAVLRRLEAAAREAREADPENRRAFLEMLGRLVRRSPDEGPPKDADAPSRLILP
jgi:hypothetical protein